MLATLSPRRKSVAKSSTAGKVELIELRTFIVTSKKSSTETGC